MLLPMPTAAQSCPTRAPSRASAPILAAARFVVGASVSLYQDCNLGGLQSRPELDPVGPPAIPQVMRISHRKTVSLDFNCDRWLGFRWYFHLRAVSSRLDNATRGRSCSGAGSLRLCCRQRWRRSLRQRAHLPHSLGSPLAARCAFLLLSSAFHVIGVASSRNGYGLQA